MVQENDGIEIIFVLAMFGTWRLCFVMNLSFAVLMRKQKNWRLQLLVDDFLEVAVQGDKSFHSDVSGTFHMYQTRSPSVKKLPRSPNTALASLKVVFHVRILYIWHSSLPPCLYTFYKTHCSEGVSVSYPPELLRVVKGASISFWAYYMLFDVDDIHDRNSKFILIIGQT